MALIPRWCILCLLVFSFVPIIQAQNDERCFPETGFCMSGRIREYWEQTGGLPVFGYPIAPQQLETVEGQPVQAQWFERNRLELHPENAAPYDVLLGRLGADRLAQKGYDWQAVPREAPEDGCRFFEQTGRNVCGDILTTWRANGLELDGQPGFTENENLALFGLPLTGLISEQMSDGRERQVQYFERARFELHPENDPPYNVLLGLLGNEVRANQETDTPPANPPASATPEPPLLPTATPEPLLPTATPEPPPPTATPEAPPATAPSAPETCDPSYPDVCIPPPPPDLDCGDIPHRRFKVLPPDPHRFDGDKDGIGCES